MAIKVHGSTSSTATMRVCSCLNEKGLDYKFVPANMRAGEHQKDPFLSLQPFGQVPAFEDGDLKVFGNTIGVQESKAGGKRIGMDGNGGPKLAWEFIHKPMMGKPTDDAVVEEYVSQLCEVLDVYETRLAQSKYLAGNSFTLADLNHLPTLSYLMETRVKAVFDSRPHVRVWFEDILERAASKKVVDVKNGLHLHI